jgi:hypothetical protein
MSALPLVMVEMLLGVPCVSNNLFRLWRQFPLNMKGFGGAERVIGNGIRIQRKKNFT